MENFKVIIYDIEIKKAILGRKEQKIPGIEYCKGWRDFKGMGISCICAYDYTEDRYRTFFDDNMNDFFVLAHESEMVVGFNSHNFDNRTVEEVVGINLDFKTYDILREVWRSKKLNPDKFSPSTHGGYGLEDLCLVNFNTTKTGSGAIAPIDFQRGHYGNLVDYCLNDVRLTKLLFDKIVTKRFLVDPKDTGNSMVLRKPVTDRGHRLPGWAK